MKRLTLTALILAAACGSSDKPGPVPASTTFKLTQLVNAVAGVEVSFTVAAVDTSGALNTNYRGTVQFATDDTRSTAPSDASFSPTDGGQITARVVFKTAGPRSFVVADKAVPSAVGIAHVEVSPAPAARLLVSGAPASTVAGQPLSIGVTTFDPYDNVASGFADAVHFASTDPKAQLPPDSAFSAADAGSRTFPVVLTKAGTTSVTVSSAALSPATVEIAVTHAQAAKVTLEGLPAQIPVDISQNVTVTVRDAFGNPVTDYAGTLRFVNSDPRAPRIPDAAFSPVDLGVKVVAVQFATAGTQTLSASDIATPSIATSLSTQVVHGPAAGLVLTGIPQSTVAGTPLTAIVTAVDNHGNLVTDFAGTVHFASTDPKAALPQDFVFTGADLGSHAFPIVLVTAATSSVIILSSALPVVTKNVAVLDAGAAQVTIEGLPSQVAIDAIQSITVRVRDAFGNPVTEYVGTLHFSNTDAQASAIPDTTFALADLGTKIVTVQFGTAGTQTVTATDTVTPSITGSRSTQVIQGPASRLLLTGLPPSTVAGTTLSATVVAVDSRGNVATDFVGTVHFSSTDPNAALTGDFVFTPVDMGSHTFPVVFTKAASSSLTVSSPGFAPATATVVVSAAPPAQVTLEGLLPQVVVDASQNVTVTVRDAFGNAATDYTGTLQFTSSDPQASIIPVATFLPTDLGVKVVAIQFGTAGLQSLSARDPATPSIAGSASTQVLHGPAARLVLTGIPPSTVAGTPLPATVTAVDNHGNVVTDFGGTVHFASTDPGAQLPGDFTFAPANLGTRTFRVVLTSAATSSVAVTSAGLPAATASVIVRPAAAAQVTLEGLPALVVVDVVQNVTVTVRDAFGNPATDYAGTLHFTNSDPQASSIPDIKFLPAYLGVKIVALRFGTAGVQTLSAADTVNSSISGSASTQVVHGPAARLLLAGIPPSTVAGTLLVTTITVVDAHGNVVTDFSGTVHFDSTDPNATLPADTRFGTTDNGVRSFPVALSTAGARSISVSQVGGTATGATVNVSVANAPASRITLDAHAGQVAVDTNAVFTVTVRDRFGNPALDYTGTVHFVPSDLAGTPIGNVTFTAAMFATTDVTVQFVTAGPQSLLASDTVNPSIAGSASILVIHGPAARLALAGIPPSTVAGTLLTPTVTALDNHGNLVNDFTGTVHVSSTDPNAQLPPDFTFTVADGGSRTFPVVLTKAASSSVTVASAGLVPATAAVVVRNAAAAQLSLTGLPAQVVVGVTQNVTVTARDAFGNTAIDYRGTVRFTNTDLQASTIVDVTFGAADLGVKVITVQFGTAGTRTLSATDTVTPSIAGSVSTVVKPGPAARLALAGFPPSTVAGTLLTPTVTALDTLNNVATDFVGTVHVTSSDPNAQLPADFTFTPADQGSRTFPVVLAKAGTSSVTVSSVGVTGASASVSVRNAPASRVTLDGLPAQIVVDVIQGITVTACDAFGNTAIDYTGTIAFTNSDTQAPAILDTPFLAADLGVKIVTVRFATAGTQTLTAKDTVRTSIAGSATTLVVHGPAAQLTLTGFPPSTVAGTLLTATVTAVDNHANLVTDFTGTVHFSSTDPGAQLPADFTFTAANLGTRTFSVVLTKAATSSITVSSTGLASATASVAVRNAPASQVTLEGLPAQVVVDALQTVTVRARDAFGNPATDFVGVLHFTNTDPQASLIVDTTFALADLGTKTVTVKFGTAGLQTLSANDTVRPTIAGSVTTLVLHGPAARLTLAGIPSSTVAGALLAATVTAVDSHGNPVTDFTGTVHFSSTDPSATLPPDTAFVAGDGGVRSFSVALTTAGSRSVSVSGTVTGATANVTVSNAPASRITLDAHAAQVAVDTNAVFTVAIRDRFANPALNYAGTVHFVSSDLRGTSIKDVTFTPAMFATTDVTLQFATAADQSLIATDTVNSTITGSTVIKVTNGPAAAYALSPLPTAAVAGEPLPLSITVTDAHGNTVLNYAGSAAVTSTDPSDRLPVPGTFVAGVRSVSLAFVTAGPHHATVSEVGGLIHADTSVVIIVSGNASTLVLTDASATAGIPASTTAVAKDAFGNVVGSYRGTVTLSSTDPQAVLPPPYTFVAADAGQHAFPVTLKTAGTWSVIATDAANAISGSATFSVAPAAGASCDLAIIGKAGAQVALRVRVSDAFANLATGYTGTLTFSSSDAQATLPAATTYIASDRGSRDFTAVLPTPGDQTIRATDSAASFSCQANVSIVTAQFFAVTFAGPEAWAGTPRPATVQAQDANGKPITSYTGTIVFSSSDPAASFPASVTVAATDGGRATVNVTFKTIGLQTFTAKDSADATKTGTAFQLVHGLAYSDPPTGGKVRLVLNAAASTASVVQLDLVSNASLFTLGIADPQNSGRVLPSSVRNGAFAAGMNLPLDGTKVGPDTQLLVQAPPASAILNLGSAPQAVGAALANGVLYSGISQKRFDLTMTCTPSCTNDHLRGDVQARPFPGTNSLYYSLRLKLTPGAAPGMVFDGQALASNTKFRAAVRDRSGSDVFSSTADFAIGKLEVK